MKIAGAGMAQLVVERSTVCLFSGTRSRPGTTMHFNISSMAVWFRCSKVSHNVTVIIMDTAPTAPLHFFVVQFLNLTSAYSSNLSVFKVFDECMLFKPSAVQNRLLYKGKHFHSDQSELLFTRKSVAYGALWLYQPQVFY